MLDIESRLSAKLPLEPIELHDAMLLDKARAVCEHLLYDSDVDSVAYQAAEDAAAHRLPSLELLSLISTHASTDTDQLARQFGHNLGVSSSPRNDSDEAAEADVRTRYHQATEEAKGIAVGFSGPTHAGKLAEIERRFSSFMSTLTRIYRDEQSLKSISDATFFAREEAFSAAGFSTVMLPSKSGVDVWKQLYHFAVDGKESTDLSYERLESLLVSMMWMNKDDVSSESAYLIHKFLARRTPYEQCNIAHSIAKHALHHPVPSLAMANASHHLTKLPVSPRQNVLVMLSVAGAELQKGDRGPLKRYWESYLRTASKWLITLSNKLTYDENSEF